MAENAASTHFQCLKLLLKRQEWGQEKMWKPYAVSMSICCLLDSGFLVNIRFGHRKQYQINPSETSLLMTVIKAHHLPSNLLTSWEQEFSGGLANDNSGVSICLFF